MNSQSYKRKRVDVQFPDPEAASRIYGRMGVDILTTPITSGRDLEVEQPRKYFIQATNQAVYQNIGPSRTAGRVVTKGVAKPLLSNEQIQQFISSTVLSNGRSGTSTEPRNPNVTNCTVYPSLPGTRVKLQTEPANVQPQLTLNELRSGQTLPWVSIQQPTQETILQKPTEYSVQQLAINSQGHIHPSAQNTFAGYVLNPTLTQAELQEPVSANELTLPRKSEVQGYTPTIVTNEWFNRTRLQVPTKNISVPVTGVYNQTVHQPTQMVHGVSSNCFYNGAYSPAMTPSPTCNVTKTATIGQSADFAQRSSAGHLESWSLRPQSLPTFVVPMEAKTKAKTKKSKKKTTTNITPNSPRTKGSKNKMFVSSVLQTTGKQMEATLHQTQSPKSASSSVTEKGGKVIHKNAKYSLMESIVVTPKVQTDKWNILQAELCKNRQKQGQVESTDDKKESVDSSPKQMATAGKNNDSTDSTHEHTTNADIKTMDTVPSNLKHKEPQSVVSRTTVPSKQSALEQMHNSLSGNTVQKVTEKCSQMKSGSKQQPMSIRKTLPEDYRPVVNTDLLVEDLSPDSFTLLEADSFYGPEILITSGSHCFVAPVPFF
ncbi:uncharacterized protein LOC134267950 [Saccostrea cucullata]|uniref:uncharacterized protein LOC134267950 n=1 Tax=Saccostrea cuccullata TaxID=36930 RepID=UPI002ED107DF